MPETTEKPAHASRGSYTLRVTNKRPTDHALLLVTAVLTALMALITGGLLIAPYMEAPWAVVAISGAGAVGAVAAALFAKNQSGRVEKDVEQQRAEILAQVSPPVESLLDEHIAALDWLLAAYGPNVRAAAGLHAGAGLSEVRTPGAGATSGETTATPAPDGDATLGEMKGDSAAHPSGPRAEGARESPLGRDGLFTRVLIEYYAYGLVQAKRAASASLWLSTFGALVLLSGVVSALVRSFSGATVTSSVVVSSSGVITTGLGTLMHRQASRALKHMEEQTAGLRADMQADRDRATALELLASMPQHDSLQARIQAGIILKLTGASLPEGSLLPIGPTSAADGLLPHMREANSTSMGGAAKN